MSAGKADGDAGNKARGKSDRESHSKPKRKPRNPKSTKSAKPAKRTWRDARKPKQKLLRCFFGLALRDHEPFAPLQQALSDVATEDDRLRLSPPENLHVTLMFLGNLPEERLDETKSLAATLCRKHAPLSLSCAGSGHFKNSIWVGIEQSEELSALANDFRQAGPLLGVPAENKPYSPHVTLARFAPASRQRFETVLEHYREQHWLTLQANKVYLYLSETHQEGPRYSILKSFQLGDTQPAELTELGDQTSEHSEPE